MLLKFNLNSIFYPLKALASRAFYLHVLFKMRGWGFYYLFLISALIAFPACVKVMDVLSSLKQMELVTLVSKIPPSYLDANGVLSPKEGSRDFVEIRNSKGDPSIIYNPLNKVLEGDELKAPIELTGTSVVFKSFEQSNAVPYSSIFPTNANFEPYEAAASLDSVFNSSWFTVWGMITLWFFAILAFNALIIALIGRILLILVSKIKINFASMLRVSSFANTVVALILLLQYFVHIPLPYTVIAFLPLIYVYLLGKDIRTTVNKYGTSAFSGQNNSNNARYDDGSNRSPKDDNNKGSGGYFAP